MHSPSATPKRRAGRRALTAFFGSVGVFFLATQILETRDAVNLAEQRAVAKMRGNEQASPSVATLEDARIRVPRAEAAKIERLRHHLYAFMAAGAMALLIVLSIALTGAPPQTLSLGLVAVAIATWWFTDEVATVLPLIVAGVLAHIPEDVWNPPAQGEA